MAEFFKVVTVDEAKAKIFEALQNNFEADLEILPISQTLGRVLGKNIASPVDVPGFKRSTMDGYAVMAKDTFGATEAMPAYITVIGEVMMGTKAEINLGAYEAVRISTGGMLPSEADAVVMIEYTEKLDDDTIEVVRPVAPGENIVNVGEDIEIGEVILRKGHILRAQDIGALAGIGILEIPVVKKPKVGIISTGDEIVAPNEETAMGQVRDINSYSISAQVEEWGGQAVLFGVVKDNFEVLRETVTQALAQCQIVVISGGSSVGTRDVTAKVLDSLGQPGVLVHGVSVRPGKPTIAASIDGKIVFGLPGHPASSMVIFEIFGKPLINALLAKEAAWSTKIVKAVMTKNYPSGSGREDYVRVALREEGGAVLAEPVLGKSGLISTMVKADGMVKIPLDKEGITTGEVVEVMLF